MSKIYYTALVNRIAGRLSHGVLSNWKGNGIVKRHRQFIHQDHSLKQQLSRSVLSDLAGEYYSLSDSCKELWKSFASLQSKPVTAFNCYVGFNNRFQRVFPNAPRLISPPLFPSTPPSIKNPDAVYDGDGIFRISFSNPSNSTLFAIIDYWPMPGRNLESFPKWTFGASCACSSKEIYLSLNLPVSTIVRFRARSMDSCARVSPWILFPVSTLSCDYFYVADEGNSRIVKRLLSDLSFVSKIGSYGTGDNNFKTPDGVTADSTYIYIADSSNNRIVKRLKSDFSFVSKIGSQGTGDDQFYRPKGISVDSTYIYVADTYNKRIVKRLKSNLSFVSKIGSYGTGDNNFSNPGGIAVDSTYIYIADTDNHRIVKRLKSDLSFISKIGSYGTGDNNFNYPSGIAVDSTYIYIADSSNNRIVKLLKSDFSFVSKIGSEGTGDDQFYRPKGISVDSTYIFVSDTNNNRIVKRLKSNLSFVSKIGSQGSGDDQFSFPYSLSTDYSYLFSVV